MGGIAGILSLDGGAVDTGDLERMREALAHRGPDGAAIQSDGRCGLVHLFLRIEDVQGVQPWLQDNLALVWDGRIDALAPPEPVPLGAPGATLVGAYRTWQEDLTPRLIGDFALALWDGRNGRLVLATDPFGVRSLYVRREAGRLLFASEAKAILAVMGGACQPDPIRMAEYRQCRTGSVQRTFFLGVRRLPPGETLVVDAAGARRKPSWQPDPQRRIRLEGPAAYEEMFRTVFFEAVRCRLPRSGTAAFTLSGGLDSSSVLSVAEKIRRAERPALRLHALSFFSRSFPDERTHIQAVLDTCPADHSVLYLEDWSPLEEVEKALWHQECPYYDVIDGYVSKLHEMARGAGARVVLSGDWGDQVLTGMGYLVDLLVGGSWAEFQRELHLLAEVQRAPVHAVLHRVLAYLLVPQRVSDRLEGLRELAFRLFWPRNRRNRFGPSFPTAAQRELYDGVFGRYNTMLLDVLDRGAAMRGLEVRLPFLDRRLVEFLLAIPPEQRVRDGVNRRILREALAGILPPTIARRNDKGDYTECVQARLRAMGFRESTHLAAVDHWDAHNLEIWERIWLGNGKSRT